MITKMNTVNIPYLEFKLDMLKNPMTRNCVPYFANLQKPVFLQEC